MSGSKPLLGDLAVLPSVAIGPAALAAELVRIDALTTDAVSDDQSLAVVPFLGIDIETNALDLAIGGAVAGSPGWIGSRIMTARAGGVTTAHHGRQCQSQRRSSYANKPHLAKHSFHAWISPVATSASSGGSTA